MENEPGIINPTDPDDIDLEKIIAQDIKGWSDFFEHPKMPYFISFIQALHYSELKRYNRNDMETDGDLRKGLKQKGACEVLQRIYSRLIDAKQGLIKARQA